MINNIKSHTKGKRKIVVPFDGEEQFVVPKKGGFGQPDNDKYVMVVGSTSRTPINTELPTTTPPVTTVPAESTTTTAPTSTAPRTSVPTEGTTTPTSLTTTTPAPAPTTTAPAPCVYNPNDFSTWGCKPKQVIAVEQTPIVGITPTFPNWASLDCPTLKAKIDELNKTMAVSRFTTDVVSLYNSQLAIAKDLLQTNCPAESPTTDVTAGGFGGGGGGGATGEDGGVPTDETALAESTDKTKMLLVLVGIGVGLYFLMK